MLEVMMMMVLRKLTRFCRRIRKLAFFQESAEAG
jgi:hypothetical protein